MARDGPVLPRAGTLNPNNVPAFALVVQSVWTAILCLTGTYRTAAQLRHLRGAALLRLHDARAVHAARQAAGRCGRTAPSGYPVLPRCTSCSAAAVMAPACSSPTTRTESISGLVLVLIGIPVFYLWRRVEAPDARRPERPAPSVESHFHAT
jgi:APA family basic amino acid/polyamine antiporter